MPQNATDDLRRLLKQANELDQRMQQLQDTFANVRDDFEQMLARKQLRPPRPHLAEPGVVDLALNALTSDEQQSKS